jgi:tellurite resistance protein
MDAREAQACLRILLAVARADGSIDDDEHHAIKQLASSLDVGAPRLREELDLDAEIAALASADARRATFEAAIAIANLDGRCTKDEHALLERLQRGFELDGSLQLQAEEEAWSERLKEPRRILAKATVEFLHAVAEARKTGDLSQERYEALVAHLREERTRALKGTLPTPS